MVTGQKGHRGAYLLLDGHVRLQILKDFGAQNTMCLIATDDEAFTCNKRISRLATIQEHKMILKAIESGLPEDRIAKALDINVALIRRKRRLLDGVSPEQMARMEAEMDSLQREMKQLLVGVEDEGWQFVAFVRLVPLFPFNILNYALGLTRIGAGPYVLATAICMIPGTRLICEWQGITHVVPF